MAINAFLYLSGMTGVSFSKAINIRERITACVVLTYSSFPFLDIKLKHEKIDSP